MIGSVDASGGAYIPRRESWQSSLIKKVIGVAVAVFATIATLNPLIGFGCGLFVWLVIRGIGTTSGGARMQGGRSYLDAQQSRVVFVAPNPATTTVYGPLPAYSSTPTTYYAAPARDPHAPTSPTLVNAQGQVVHGQASTAAVAATHFAPVVTSPPTYYAAPVRDPHAPTSPTLVTAQGQVVHGQASTAAVATTHFAPAAAYSAVPSFSSHALHGSTQPYVYGSNPPSSLNPSPRTSSVDQWVQRAYSARAPSPPPPYQPKHAAHSSHH